MSVPVTGGYPAVEFQPSETGSVYHTDQEFTDSKGSHLFRTYNAQYNGTNWQTIPSAVSGDAYATVQDPDGSIHYYYNGGLSTWSSWQGSDNNTIYNAVDFGVIASGMAAGNFAALTSLFTALSSASVPGGSVRIPQNNYQVVGTFSSATLTVPDQTILQGLGTGGSAAGGSFGPYYHFTIADSGGAASALFYVDGPHTSGGVELRNLAFGWLDAAAGYVGDTAINMGMYAGLLYRCTFTSIPTAVNFGGYSGAHNALSSSMVQCQVRYESGPDNATSVAMAGQQLSLLGGILLQTGPNPNAGDGPTGCTGVAIGGGGQAGQARNEHNVIDGVHFTDWTICVDYADTNDAIVQGSHSGCEFTTIANCEMVGYGWGSDNPYIGCCLNMGTYGNSGVIYGQKIIGNTMFKSQNSATTNAANPIVLIDTGYYGNAGGAEGGPYSNSNVSSIDLIGNLIFSGVTNVTGFYGEAQDNQYGVLINGGESIRIIGGKIGNLGNQHNLYTDGSANICISSAGGNGGPGSLLIEGVDLRPTYPNVQGGSMGAADSQYGILVSATLTNGPVLVNGCNLSGYSHSMQEPVYVSGSVASNTFYVTNCPGYNDQNTVINTLGNIFTGTAYAAYNQTAHGGTSYYGPSFVMFTANSMPGASFQINGGATQNLLASQVVCLMLESPYDTI